MLVLVVVPEIWAQHLGTANPTILPGDYAGRLLVVLAVVAGLTLVAVGGGGGTGPEAAADVTGQPGSCAIRMWLPNGSRNPKSFP